MNDTAEAFWEGRRIVSSQEPLARKGGRILFSVRPELPARRSYPAGAAVELSTQLQAWMVLEAAASIAGRSDPTAPDDAERDRRAGRDSRDGAGGTGGAGRGAARRRNHPRNPRPGIKSRNSFVIHVILIT